MARKANKNDRPDADRSKQWEIEIDASSDCQDILDKAIDLVLQAENRSAKPDFGDSGLPSPGDT